MNKKSYRYFLRKNRMKKPNKKRNPVARQLRHFKKKVIKSKKIYDRKKHGKTHRHNTDSYSSETTS